MQIALKLILDYITKRELIFQNSES